METQAEPHLIAICLAWRTLTTGAQEDLGSIRSPTLLQLEKLRPREGMGLSHRHTASTGLPRARNQTSWGLGASPFMGKACSKRSPCCLRWCVQPCTLSSSPASPSMGWPCRGGVGTAMTGRVRLCLWPRPTAHTLRVAWLLCSRSWKPHTSIPRHLGEPASQR